MKKEARQKIEGNRSEGVIIPSYRHPEVVEVLKKLYKKAYMSGTSTGGEVENTADGYDWSTAYEELTKLLDQYADSRLEEYRESVKTELRKVGTGGAREIVFEIMDNKFKESEK